MLSRLVAAAMCLLPFPAFADGPWMFEWEFGYKVAASRIMSADCHKVAPLGHADFYSQLVRIGGQDGPAYQPTAGFLWSCGGSNPVYNHFLGRRCAKPLPNLVFECGWRHMSHAWDHTETHYDALAVRGRFSWGKR
jgi:hypothetical protein